MSEKTIKWRELIETLTIFRRSLIFQTKEFFQNSTLHGVRYIAETGRPVGEKFMWFCFTSIGAITALVIIMSLWEKFQTNPTITGLDTDFHNQNVIFPTTVVCPVTAYDHDVAYSVANKNLANYNEDDTNAITPFLEILTSLSYDNMKKAYEMAKDLPLKLLEEKTLRQWAFQVQINCEKVLIDCKYRDEGIKCCSHFDTVYTEHGLCFAFNSRFKSMDNADLIGSAPHDLYETDKKWALLFVPNITSKIFIFSNEEYFGKDFNAQIDWNEGQVVEARISKRNTYTTDDARQLTIGQRKCIFFDEVKLQYFPEEYTFSSCMKECRMKKAIKLCKCNPPFYKPIPNVRMCGVSDFLCLDEHKDNITRIKDCLHCELSCSKTVFNIEKLVKNMDHPDNPSVLVEFLTWPIIRYKREVLFGWVDLLVSFGGIASLFLGFSLLSGVEIIYYFTLRACCMVYRNRKELYEIEENIRRQPPPPINLSLKPIQMLKAPLVEETEEIANNPLIKNELNKRRRAIKVYQDYSKSLFQSKRVLPSFTEPKNAWDEYLP